MAKHDVTKTNLAVEKLLAVTDNPRHRFRFLLQAFRRERKLMKQRTIFFASFALLFVAVINAMERSGAKELGKAGTGAPVSLGGCRRDTTTFV